MSLFNFINSKLVREWGGLVLALYGLNFALTFHNVWPTLGITTRHELSVEIAVLILVLMIYSRLKLSVSSRTITILAVVLTVLTIARYLEVTAVALYGRHINLYWDAQHLPHVIAMLSEVTNSLTVILLISVLMLALYIIFFAFRHALARIITSSLDIWQYRIVIIIMSVLIFVYMVGHTNSPFQTKRFYSLPITETYWQQAKFILKVLNDKAGDTLPATKPLGNFDLPQVDNVDVIIQFVESYGAIAFDNPAVSQVIAPVHEKLITTIEEKGRYVVSAFVESPTFGGNSWLAHSSFMTGLEIKHTAIYDLLLTQDRETLATRFSALGYRPIALMPGLRSEWPEGSFYGYESIYGAREINYNGPEFGWWRVPDQFALARITNIEMSNVPRRPLFLFFTTISSHMPFRPTPPYQPDWTRILSEKPFDDEAISKSLSTLPEWMNMQPAYAGSLAYTFTYLDGFLRAHQGKDYVWIVIGDHQPPANVSGQGVRWDTPVHVISRNFEIIKALKQHGFKEGMTPKNKSIGTMHDLPVMLLSAFSKKL